jgi:Polyketide cyclase / dehydrase and lipid transport
MRWVWIIGGALALLVVAMAALGTMLPVKHHATRKARFHAKPETIYAILAGPPDWRPDVKAYGSLPDEAGRKTWWEEGSSGHGRKIRFELVEDQPPVRRVVRIADRGLPFGGAWTFEIAPATDGADVRIHEDGEIYNPVFRFLSRFIFGYYGSIEGFLRNLGARLGEPVRIED